MDVSENRTNTLRAESHGHAPIAFTLKVRGGQNEIAKVGKLGKEH